MLDLIKFFDERTQGWEEKLSRDEWFFTNIRKEIIKSLCPAEAFDLLPQAAMLVLRDQKYDLRVSECVQLLLALARHSNTTEMPKELSAVWPQLISRLCSFGDYEKRQAEELCQWYRKECPENYSAIKGNHLRQLRSFLQSNMNIWTKFFNKKKTDRLTPARVRITRENLAQWPNYQKLHEQGKVIFDSQGRLRYGHGAPVGDFILVRINKDGTPKYQESAEEWFDPDSQMAKDFEWPK